MDSQKRNSFYLFLSIFVLVYVKTTEAKFVLTVLKNSFVCTEHYAENCTTKYEKLENGSYSYSMYADILNPIDEKAMIFMRSYELKNGQWKKGMLQFDKNFCDFISSDFWMLKMIRGYTNLPNKCPVPAGPMYVNEFVAKEASFPPGFPKSTYKLVFGMRLGDLELSDTEVEFKIDNK